MAFVALAARRAIATSSRSAGIPGTSMAVHFRQAFGAARMLSRDSSSYRREVAKGARRCLSSSGEGEFEDAVARSKGISNPVRCPGHGSPKNFPVQVGFFRSVRCFFSLPPPLLGFRIFSYIQNFRPCPGQRHPPLALRPLQAGEPRPLRHEQARCRLFLYAFTDDGLESPTTPFPDGYPMFSDATTKCKTL